MEEQKKPTTGQQPNEQGKTEEEKDKKDIHNDALYAASMGRPATAQVDPHSNSGLANTCTNISYEGATAPGSGGSVGTGYASGKSAVDPSITTDPDYDKANVGGTNNEKEAEDEKHDEEKDII
jgi:hypothetical protein